MTFCLSFSHEKNFRRECCNSKTSKQLATSSIASCGTLWDNCSNISARKQVHLREKAQFLTISEKNERVFRNFQLSVKFQQKQNFNTENTPLFRREPSYFMLGATKTRSIDDKESNFSRKSTSLRERFGSQKNLCNLQLSPGSSNYTSFLEFTEL